MNIVEHRPPLKRIDFGIKPRAPEPPEDAAALARRGFANLAVMLEQERIWRLVERSSQGQGSGA